MGVRAATINSSNKDEWVAVQARLLASIGYSHLSRKIEMKNFERAVTSSDSD